MTADPLRSTDPDPWSLDDAAYPAHGSEERQLRFLLRYAILAPSTHNSEPWEFEIGDRRIDVFVDRARWLPVADADERELHLSVGCALENLLVAAEHHGLVHDVHYFPRGPDHELAARVHLRPDGEQRDPPRPPTLFDAIRDRRTHRGEYSGDPVSPDRLEALAEVAAAEGVGVRFVSGAEVLRPIARLLARADAIQFSTPERWDELTGWLGREMLRAGWFVSRVSRVARAYLGENGGTVAPDREPLRGAGALGVLELDRVDRTGQVRAGQAFERLFLAATAERLALQPLSQILQVPALRGPLRDCLGGDGGEPQLLFRLGHAAEPAEHSPRRPLSYVVA